MKNTQHKARILFIGPTGAGKTRIANYLADQSLELPESSRPTDTLRILEYDVNNVEIDGVLSNVDVQIWDTSGNEKTMSYWPIFRDNTDGIVFVHSVKDEESGKKLDHMYNNFVMQNSFSPRACLVCIIPFGDVTTKLPPVFSKLSQVVVNLDVNAEKFRSEFSKFVVAVVNAKKIK